MDMSIFEIKPTYKSSMARAELDDQGWWIITIAGRDVRVAVGRDEDITFEGFPGFAMGHRLIEQGYMPDRSDTDDHPSGWRLTTDKNAWVIPCYPIE